MAIDRLKDDSVIVFIDGSNLHLTPQPVQDAMISEPALGPLPIIATFDATIQKPLGVVGYRAMKDVNGFKDVTAALAKLRGKEVASVPVVKARPEIWKDSRGRSLRATYEGSTTDEVTLRLENGKHTTLKLSTLSEASQKRVAALAGK